MKSAQLAEIESLIDVAKRNRLTFLRVNSKSQSIKLSFQTASGAAGAREEANQTTPSISSSKEHIVPSPLVGFFHGTTLTVGNPVTEDTVVCVIESLGLMNDVPAGSTGKVEAILAAEGEPVQYGQALVRIGT